MSDADLYVLKERVKWRSRRGLLELDLYFTRFLAEQLESFNAEQLEDLLDLLTCDDIALWAMVSGRKACEVERWKDMVVRLQASAPGSR